MAKQKFISDELYKLIQEFHECAVHYSTEDIQETLVRYGYTSFKLKSDLIERDKCPECGEGDLITTVDGYETHDVRGEIVQEPNYIKKCDSCGFIID